MNNVIFNKILIADIQDKKAFCQKLNMGLNIVTSSDNHVGKSSFIKSLYYSMGAETQYDDIWQKSTKIYITKFSVGNNSYKISRYNDNFILQDNEDNILVQTNKITSELAPVLARIFNFAIFLTDKEGKTVLAPPAFYYLPYYLDQDLGWTNAPFVSFMRLDQFKKNKRLESLYYHLGVYDQKRQEVQQIIDNNKETIASLNLEKGQALSMIILLEDISSYSLAVKSETDVEVLLNTYKKTIETKISNLNLIRDKMHQSEIALCKYNQQKEIVTAYTKIKNRAVLGEGKTQEKPKICHQCPKCGFEFEDNLIDIVFAQYANQNEDFVERQISYLVNKEKKQLENLKIQYLTASDEIEELENMVQSTGIDFKSYLVAKGSEEAFKTLNTKIGKITVEIAKLEKENKELLKDIDNKISKKETDKLYHDNLKSQLIDFQAWDEQYDKKLKITQPLTGSGTLSTKIILAGYLALFKTMKDMNISTPKFPIVIDSPRTKEPSEKSSKLILDSIVRYKYTEQTILATMNFNNYSNNYEDITYNLIELNKLKSLLNKETFDKYAKEIESYYDLLNLKKQ